MLLKSGVLTFHNPVRSAAMLNQLSRYITPEHQIIKRCCDRDCDCGLQAEKTLQRYEDQSVSDHLEFLGRVPLLSESTLLVVYEIDWEKLMIIERQELAPCWHSQTHRLHVRLLQAGAILCKQFNGFLMMTVSTGGVFIIPRLFDHTRRRSCAHQNWIASASPHR